MKERIDIHNLTKTQLNLLIPIIEAFIRNYENPASEDFQNDDLWDSFTDPETGLVYDLNFWVTDDENETMSVSLYNVIQSKDPQYMTIESGSDRIVWSSCDWSFEDWKKFHLNKGESK